MTKGERQADPQRKFERNRTPLETTLPSRGACLPEGFLPESFL
jgi:hypothetical protein